MNKTVSAVVLLIFVSVISYNSFKIQSLETENERLSALVNSLGEEAGEEIEVADIMSKLQLYMNKMWFAQLHSNWPLIEFYIEEMEETMEILSNSTIVDDNIDISGLMLKFGLEPLDKLKEVVASQDQERVKDSYADLISNCNNCHKISDHSFVVIVQPATPVFDNQDYIGTGGLSEGAE